MIIQGSNNPLIIKFDQQIEDIPRLVITLWQDRSALTAVKVAHWENADMLVSGDTAVCPITEAQTGALPSTELVLEAKGLDGEGNTVFWDEYRVDIKRRRDRVIHLTQGGG